MTIVGYVGTYTTGKSQGIYTFSFSEETSSFISSNLFYEILNPKYLCFAGTNNEYIAAVCDFPQSNIQNADIPEPLCCGGSKSATEQNAKSGIVLLDKNGNCLSTLAYENTTSCYITYKSGIFYTANYHEGTVSAIKLEKDNSLKLLHKTLIREKAGCHQVLFYKDKILVPSLFLDKIIVLNESLEIESHIDFPANCGPRHGVFTSDYKYLFVVGELDNIVYTVDTSLMKIVSKTNILENEQTHLKDSAAIRLSKDEKTLYISTRTLEVISVFNINEEKLELIQYTSCEGKHPRDFEITENTLFVANRLTNNISAISIEKNLLSNLTDTVYIPEAISIIIESK